MNKDIILYIAHKNNNNRKLRCKIKKSRKIKYKFKKILKNYSYKRKKLMTFNKRCHNIK